MSYTSPNFDYWRTRPTLKVWFVAAMMHGVEPHRMTDVTDSNGDSLDLADDIQLLISAALVGDITAFPTPGQLPDAETEVSKASLEIWLRGRGYADLAGALDALQNQPPTATPPTSPASDQHAPASTPVPRFMAQEDAIFATLKTLGHNPLQLPKNPPGKRGVKADVKDTLGCSGIWSGSTVFAKAWERMLTSGTIVTKK